MIDPKDPPLRGIALHNPQLLSKEELERDFVARGAELARLVDSLRKRAQLTPQHHLVLGHRGMGKTTLLHRLAHVITDDAALSAAYLPLLFPEEQYNVARLSDVWLNCLDALSDRLDLMGDVAGSEEVDRAVDDLHGLSDDAVIEQRALHELTSRARALGLRLVLLIDNVDLVLDRIGAERQWAFRDVLEGSSELVVVGASAAAVESAYDYGAAFYDFFRVHLLGPLSSAEVRDVLLALAKRHGNEQVERIVLEQGGRLEALRVLAGGNPRTIVTLYSVFAAGPDGDVRGDLEVLLDRHTPLYKARFEALPAQAQQVVDALCLLWDPATARQIADHARIDVNAVSSQLNRLQKEGVVEKARSGERGDGPAKGRTAFQVTERFFNIWYMMRASRRVRRKLAWFVSCLELLYGPEEVLGQARRLFEAGGAVRDAEAVAELALALSDAVRDEGARLALVHRALEAAEASGRPLCEDGDDQVAAAEAVRAVRRERSERFWAWVETVPEGDRSRLHAPDGSVFISWGVRSDRMASGNPANKDFDNLVGELESLILDAQLLALLRPLVRDGADATDPDVRGRVRVLLGEEAEFQLGLQAAGVVEALVTLFQLAGGSTEDVPTLDLEDPGVVEAWSRETSGMGLAVLALAKVRQGRMEASIQDLVEVLRMDAMERSVMFLVNLATRRLVGHGLARRLGEVFDQEGLSERHRPLREALRAAAAGDPSVFDGLAPEVAEAARTVFESFQVPKRPELGKASAP